jgi:predicted nucleic acid-binding protein
MVVVSDTSPISSLIQIGQERILEKLFGTVLVPVAVHDELLRFHRELPHFVRVGAVADHDRVNTLLTSLDRGEAEAIVLAVESVADYLVMDERRGRAIAIQSGIPVIGLLGVLLLAKRQGLVESVKDCVLELRARAGFYVTASVLNGILAAAHELGTSENA